MGIQESDLFWNLSDPGWAKSSYGNFFAPWTAGAAVYIHQVRATVLNERLLNNLIIC